MMTKSGLPVMRLKMPLASDLIPYLNQIDHNLIYTNYGPLYTRFRAELAEYFQVDEKQLFITTSATAAITALSKIENYGAPISVPSWTFTATALGLATGGASCQIEDLSSDLFSDDDFWPEYSGAGSNRGVEVAPFGSFSEALVKRTNDHGCLFVDAAASFDALRNIGSKLNPEQSAPMVVSLHATKGVSCGEGGVLIASRSLVRECVKWSNFGFNGERVSELFGTNAKISEYTAAIGLASLAQMNKLREALTNTANCYDKYLDPRLIRPQAFKAGNVTMTYVVGLPNFSKKNITDALAKKEIGYRDWWSEGLHSMRLFNGMCVRNSYPLTDYLCGHTLGLPFGLGFTEYEIEEVCEVINNSLV